MVFQKTHVLDALRPGTAAFSLACGEPGQAVPPFATEGAASHATPEARSPRATPPRSVWRRARGVGGVLYSRVVPRSRATSTSRRWRHVPRRRRDAPGGDGARRAPRRPSRTFSRRGHPRHAPPPFIRLPAARVALRARVLRYVRVPRRHVLAPAAGSATRPASLCEDGVASLKPDGANACLVLDDQVALVPAPPTVFLYWRGTEGRPRVRDATRRRLGPASDLERKDLGVFPASQSLSDFAPAFPLRGPLRCVLCRGGRTGGALLAHG